MKIRQNFFFFSSRRRHTRYWRDWSSDVCSSDLARVESNIEPSVWVEPQVVIEVLADEITRSPVHPTGAGEEGQGYALRFPRLVSFRQDDKKPEEIGRASCRERV